MGELGARTVDGETEQGDIARRLRAARARAGLSREELAVRAGLSWSAIAQIEAGRRKNLRPATLAACAEALGVTVDYLLSRTTHKDLLEHHALVYENEDQFAATAASFLKSGIDRDEPALAVTSARNIELLRDALGREARHVTFADSEQWYSAPVAALAAYRRFAVEAIDRGVVWTRVLGEPVWGGRSDGDVKFWTRYEALLNLAFAGLPLTLVCPYDAEGLDPAIVEHARSTHAETLGPDGLAANEQYVDPGEFILRP
jgi:transcriptional regulator with XRE-family HTH domain